MRSSGYAVSYICALALGWPDRIPDAAQAVDWAQAQSWQFEPVDHEAFPLLGLAVRAGRSAGVFLR